MMKMKRPFPLSPILPLALMSCLAGCREGVPPFAVDNPGSPPADTYQLTFSIERDFNPTWSRNSDSVYYSTDRFIDRPDIGATLIRIARSGGVADLLAPGAQSGPSHRLVLPVPSPAGDRIAFVHIPVVATPSICRTSPPDPPDCPGSQPLLQTGFVRVRDAASTASVGFDASVRIDFEGFDEGSVQNGLITFDQQLHPFQGAFAQRGEFQVRPSWSPDGQRLVFSDGMRLLVWDVSRPTADSLPNTMEGVSPAWSPTGDVIAFVRHFRTDSVQFTCRCYDLEPPTRPEDIPVHNRWTYTIGRTAITLVSPDGSNPVEIVEGEDPAWSPDGSNIYYVADNQILRIARSGGTPVAVPGTVDGRWPSVSPDGQWLAFVRTAPLFIDSNIWIIRLAPWTEARSRAATQ